MADDKTFDSLTTAYIVSFFTLAMIVLLIAVCVWRKKSAHGRCDRSAEDAYSSMAPDPTSAFVGDSHKSRELRYSSAPEKEGALEMGGELMQESRPFHSNDSKECIGVRQSTPGREGALEMGDELWQESRPSHSDDSRKFTGLERPSTSSPETEDSRKFTGLERPSTSSPETEVFDFGNEIRITLLGKTGNGKSATGNLILGEELFKTKICAKSVTVGCKRERKKRFGVNIDVVDTPGLFDTGTSNETVFKEIVKCIGITSPGPHAFLLVLSVTSRFTPEEEETVNNFVKRFGDHIYHYLIVIITRKDELERDRISEDQYMEDIPSSLNNLLQKCGNRYMFLNNRDNDDNKETQCFELLAKINKNVKRQSHPYYTDENYQDAERVFKEREEERKKEIEVELLNQLREEIARIKASSEEEKERLIKELQEKKDKTMVEKLADFRENEKKDIENEATKEGGTFESLLKNVKKMGYSAVDAAGDAIQLGWVTPQHLYGAFKVWRGSAL